MIILNCTEAAKKFFTITNKGKQSTCIQQTTDKTIEEAMNTSFNQSSVNSKAYFQWHWCVDIVTLKGKKYLLVVDYISRYCLVFAGGRKGKHDYFKEIFNTLLISNFNYWAKQHKITSEQINACIAEYKKCNYPLVFYQRLCRPIHNGYINYVKDNLKIICRQSKNNIDTLEKSLNYSIITAKKTKRRLYECGDIPFFFYKQPDFDRKFEYSDDFISEYQEEKHQAIKYSNFSYKIFLNLWLKTFATELLSPKGQRF
jgi:hypothetical protein